MKKRLNALIFILMVASGICGQTTDKTVEVINKRYADIAEKARLAEADDEQGQFGGLVVNTLTINSRGHQWRAVNIYGQTYKFFYRGGNDEKRMYPDQLVLVVNDKKISNHNYREEYLFSDTGALVYYFYSDDLSTDKPNVIKVWFASGKAIRVQQHDGRIIERMTKPFVFTTNQRLATAARLMQFFKSSIALS